MSEYMWMPPTRKASRPKVPASTKTALKNQADKLVEEHLKPKHIQHHRKITISTIWWIFSLNGMEVFFIFAAPITARAREPSAHLLSRSLPEWHTTVMAFIRCHI